MTEEIQNGMVFVLWQCMNCRKEDTNFNWLGWAICKDSIRGGVYVYYVEW